MAPECSPELWNITGLPVPARADMKPGGVYDLADALNAIQAENEKKKTEQVD
jgi:hypothetical protein